MLVKPCQATVSALRSKTRNGKIGLRTTRTRDKCTWPASNLTSMVSARQKQTRQNPRTRMYQRKLRQDALFQQHIEPNMMWSDTFVLWAKIWSKVCMRTLLDLSWSVWHSGPRATSLPKILWFFNITTTNFFIQSYHHLLTMISIPPPTNFSAFHDYCLPNLLSLSSASIILCDFPSRIPDPPPQLNIFGLEDFPLFLNAAFSQTNCNIFVVTQHALTLKKPLLPPCPLPRPFIFLTRTSGSVPYELKIIQIINSLPPKTYTKINHLTDLLPFAVSLREKEGEYNKQFDLFQLILNSAANFVAIEFSPPSPIMYGLMCADQ